LSAFVSGVQLRPLRGPVEQVPLPHTPGVPPAQVEQTLTGSIAPVRKISDWRGRPKLVAPVLHVALPVPAPAWFAMTLITQVPVAVLAGFGMASGAPKMQPGLVQWRWP